MPAPASNQCPNINAIINEVAEGRMVWSGSAMGASTKLITWLEFKDNVVNDGTNPDGLANNQCPRYDKLLARAVIGIEPPDGVLATYVPAFRELHGFWGNPTSGATPDAYEYQVYQDSILRIDWTEIPYSSCGSPPCEFFVVSPSISVPLVNVYFKVRSKLDSLVSTTIESNSPYP